MGRDGAVRRWVRRAAVAACGAALRGEALACPNCFAAGGARALRGFYWGAALLTVVPFAVAGSIVAWVVYTTRRSRAR